MKARLSIYAICFNMLIYLVLSVSIAGAVAAFPEAGETAVQYLLTVPSLACIVGTFLVPLLGTRVSQKNLSVGAQLFSLIGAAVYVVYPYSLPLLYAASIVMGLSYGVLSTTFPLLVNIHVPEQKRGYVIGIASGMVQFGRLASLLIAGFLGDIRWNDVYLTYVLVAASAVLLIVCLPQDAPLPKPARSRSMGAFLKSPGIVELAVVDFVFGILYFMTSTHVSLYIEGYGFGTASATGLITSVSCGVAGVVACLFSAIYKVTKKKTLFYIFLALGAGYLLSGLVVSMPSILFGILCSTAAASIFTPYVLMRAAEVAEPEMVPMAVSVAVACLSIGFFISPSVSNFVAGTLSDGSPASVYLFGGIGALLTAAVIFLIGKKAASPARRNA